MAIHAKTRLIALIGPMSGDRQAVHTASHPLEPELMLPLADVVLLISDENEDAMLFRYTAHGEAGGDTYHSTMGEAREQAMEEYGEALLPWEIVPDDIDDAHTYASWYALERLNDRG